jgi:hypothetical protein
VLVPTRVHITEDIIVQKHIRSGEEVVKDFIASLDKNTVIDKQTLIAIRDLHAAGKLTRTRLLGLLEKIRTRR